MKAVGDTAIPCSDCSLFPLPDSECSWTATAVTLSLPLQDPLAPASSHVSACSPRPALPVLYRPPVNRSHSFFWSLSPVCAEGLHLSQLQPFPNQPWSSSCSQHLGAAVRAGAGAGELLPGDLPFPRCSYVSGLFSEAGLCCSPQGQHLYLYLEVVPLIIDIVLQ